MPELLPRFTAAMQQIEDARKIGRILAETGDAPAAARGATPVGDPRRLRGLPAIGRHVGGAIPGTNPLSEVIRREEQRHSPRSGAR